MYRISGVLLLTLLATFTSFQVSGCAISYGEKNPAANAVKSIQNVLEWQEKFGFNGSVVVVKNGSVILKKGYGYANKQLAFHNTPQTLYYIASVSKPITAMAVMKLVEQQRINLHDPIAKYFSDVPENKKAITLEELLTHTSGLAHTYSCDNIADRDQAITTILTNTKLVAPIGTKFNYSGDNYTLLAAIVEIVTGKKFETYVHDNVLLPAGIDKPAFTGTIDRVKLDDLASPSEGSAFHSLKDIQPTWGRKGRAGMMLSVEDLYKIDKAFVGYKILAENTVKNMLSPKIQVAQGPNYGYGFSLAKTADGISMFGHSGDDDGVGHNVDYLDFPEQGIKVFIATNSGLYTGTSWSAVISSLIQKILLDSGDAYPGYALDYNEFRKYSSESSENLEGVYQSNDLVYHVWINNEGKLIASPIGKALEEFIPSDKNELTRKIIEGISQNDFQQLQVASKDANDFEKNKATLAALWKSITERNGGFERVEILGTANIWSANYQANVATWFKIVGKKNTKLYRLEWNSKDKIAGFGGGRIPYPMMFTLNSIAKDEFIGFDVANGRKVAINFLAQEDASGKRIMEVNLVGKKPILFSNSGDEVLLPKRSAAEVLYQVINEKGIPAALEAVSAIKQKLNRFDVDEGDINDVGYKLLNNEKTNEAITVFTILVNAFPESANGFDSLGEAYMKAGNKQEAIKNYKKSIELDPKNDNARKMIEKMNG